MNSLSLMPCTSCGAVPEWSPAHVELKGSDQPYVCAECEGQRQPWSGMITEAPDEGGGRWVAADVPY